MRLQLPAAQLGQTAPANQLALIGNHVSGIVAENAGGMIFFQYDLVAVYENFQRVLQGKIHGAAKLHGDHNAPQRVICYGLPPAQLSVYILQNMVNVVNNAAAFIQNR